MQSMCVMLQLQLHKINLPLKCHGTLWYLQSKAESYEIVISIFLLCANILRCESF
jgi:hypothetical protein